MMPFDDHATICFSRGAPGADLQWGMTAGRRGHGVFHMSFDGHNTAAPAEERVILTQTRLAEATTACERAAAALARRFPPASAYQEKIIRGNYFPAAWGRSLYGVGVLTAKGRVAGDTAWAVQMFMDRHDGGACPLYFFCQRDSRWYEWAPGWKPIYSPPVPTGLYGAVGSRQLDSMGRLAIRVLMDYRAAPAVPS